MYPRTLRLSLQGGEYLCGTLKLFVVLCAVKRIRAIALRGQSCVPVKVQDVAVVASLVERLES